MNLAQSGLDRSTRFGLENYFLELGPECPRTVHYTLLLSFVVTPCSTRLSLYKRSLMKA